MGLLQQAILLPNTSCHQLVVAAVLVGSITLTVFHLVLWTGYGMPPGYPPPGHPPPPAGE
eukprot:5553540-Amphidinium_carterae.1